MSEILNDGAEEMCGEDAPRVRSCQPSTLADATNQRPGSTDRLLLNQLLSTSK